jgi:hypothetical protein
MRPVCASVCLAAGMTTSAAVFADQQAIPLGGTGSPQIHDVTVTGCVTASDSNKYVIDVIEDRNDPATPAGAAIAPGTPLRLAGLPPGDFQDYVGQQVEVFGMLLPRGSSHGGDGDRGGGDGNAENPMRKAKLGVRYIRQLSPTCPLPPAPAPVAVAAPEKDADVAMNRGRGKGRRNRGVVAPTPAAAPTAIAAPKPPLSNAMPTTTGAQPVVNNTSATAGAQPANNTATKPGFVGTAPSNSTTSNAGLGQSGISGSATLGGSFSMTPPQVIVPINRPASGATPSPVPGATQPAGAGTTQPAVPGSIGGAVPGSTQAGAPGSTPAPTGSAVPGTSTLPPGFAQGATNSSTTNGTLDQVGVSGDALLSGLVNVNVQQLLASVQVQATLNVQDVIVNLSDILNDNQIQLLVQALNTNPQAALNANDLTSALQGSGLIDPSQWVVGVTGSQIYANKTLTDALQSRGIIQPSETIMGTANPHVFVVGPGGGQ